MACAKVCLKTTFMRSLALVMLDFFTLRHNTAAYEREQPSVGTHTRKMRWD